MVLSSLLYSVTTTCNLNHSARLVMMQVLRVKVCNTRADNCIGGLGVHVKVTHTKYESPVADSTPRGFCEDGEVRLEGGDDDSVSRQGRLEICFNDAWGTVCSSSFGPLDAQVACNQLAGFQSEGARYQSTSVEILFYCTIFQGHNKLKVAMC